MATVSPTITATTTPGLQITMAGGVTYEEFLNSLGQFVYYVERYQMSAQGYDQIQEKIAYNIYDSNGQLFDQAIISNVNPYQSTASLIRDLTGMDIILNGRSSVSLNIFPNEFIQLILCCNEVSGSEYLNRYHENNFRKVDDDVGNLKLFEGYKSCL